MEPINWNNDEAIIRYIDGELNGENLKLFLERMSNESDLKRRVDEYEIIKSSIQLHGRAGLRQEIVRIGKNYSRNEELSKTETKSIIMNQTKKKKFPLIGIAATAVILIAGFFVIQNNKGVDPAALYAEHHKPQTAVTNKYLDKLASSGFAAGDSDTSAMVKLPTGMEITREEYLQREAARKESLTSSLSIFKKGKWSEARIALHAYVSEYVFKKEDHQVALFHLAKSMMNSEDYSAAAERYEDFLKGEKLDDEIMDVAEFDRAIVWLQLNPQEAKKYLKAISINNAHTYQSSAKGLYDSL